jgi:hypothetical protein
MVYNVLNAQTGIVGYTYRDLEAITGHNFAQNIYAELIENKITVRDIFSDSYIESVGSKKAAVHSLDRVPNWKKFVTSRYIPKITLDITHQLDIYNDVVAIYNWHEGEVFGVEIHNPKVATFQRQLFELVWNLAIPEDKLLKEDLITP